MVHILCANTFLLLLGKVIDLLLLIIDVRVRPERLPVDDMTKREYASKRHSYANPPNNKPFPLKQVTSRIQICQSCRTSIPRLLIAEVLGTAGV